MSASPDAVASTLDPSTLPLLGRQFGPESGLATVLPESADPGGDLPAIPDPRRAYPRLAAVLSSLAVPLVLATAGGHLGPGFVFSDVVVLGIGLLLAAAVFSRVAWTAFDQHWLFVVTAAQIVFVASLDTMTGGGGSPFFALYAPVLALAAWHLRGALVGASVVLVAATEIWRATVIEQGGDVDQITIALPFFAGLAALSWLTANRLTVALVTIRQDQVRTAAILDGVAAVGAAPSDDPLAQLVTESERAFGCRAGIVTFQDGDTLPLVSTVPATGGGGYLRIPVSGARGHHALLQLWRERPFSANEVRLASILAGAAAKAADGRWLLERVRVESERDALTGLLNRRAFDRDLAMTMDDAQTLDDGAPPPTLFFLDVDAFKAFNDQYGHGEGDRLLQHVAEGLLSIVRHGDRVYRLGGDEFAIIARGLTKRDATDIAARLSDVPSSSRRRPTDDRPSATLSIGVAQATASIADGASLLASADAAMYAAKRRRSIRGGAARARHQATPDRGTVGGSTDG